MGCVSADAKVPTSCRKCAGSTGRLSRNTVALSGGMNALQGIRARAQADTSLASALALSLKLVRRYKDKLAQALETKQLMADDVTAAELERVIRLEAFVLGGAEHRTEVVGRFAGWSNEELEAFRA